MISFFGKVLYFIYFLTRFSVFYFIKQLYTEKMYALLNAVYNYLVRKLCFQDRPRCRAVFLTFWNFPCLNPAEKYQVFCEYHLQRRRADHTAYHLMNNYYDERAFAQHCALKGINSERMFEFNRSHDLGHNVYFMRHGSTIYDSCTNFVISLNIVLAMRVSKSHLRTYIAIITKLISTA